MRQVLPEISDYKALHYLINHESFGFTKDMHHRIESIEEVNQFNHTRVQAEEILQRYNRIRQVMQQTISEPDPLQKTLFTERLDNILLASGLGLCYLTHCSFFSFSKRVLAGPLSNGRARLVSHKNDQLGFSTTT